MAGNQFGPVIDELIEALTILPGVGQKTAQRMALHLLERDQQGASRLARAVEQAVQRIGRCHRCHTFTETEVCQICRDTQRDPGIVCVVESSSDLLAIEQSHHFKGQYFVLMGSLSPLDGRGPAQIGIPKLVERIKSTDVREIILATNPTIEGEATAHYIAEVFADDKILLTRLAHGIPMGGELGYVDGGTLSHAFSGRKPLDMDLPGTSDE